IKKIRLADGKKDYKTYAEIESEAVIEYNIISGGAGNTRNYGIYTDDEWGPRIIKDNYIYGNYGEALENSVSILNDDANTVIINNMIHPGNAAYFTVGISIQGGDIWIENNQISKTSSELASAGINIDASDIGRGLPVVIINNSGKGTIWDNRAEDGYQEREISYYIDSDNGGGISVGIFITESNNNVIIDNNIIKTYRSGDNPYGDLEAFIGHKGGSYGMMCYETKATITNNIIYNGVSIGELCMGLYSVSGSDLYIACNKIYGGLAGSNNSYGINIDYSLEEGKADIINNMIFSGIASDDTYGINTVNFNGKIVNNTITTGLNMTGDSVCINNDASNPSMITNNILYSGFKTIDGFPIDKYGIRNLNGSIPAETKNNNFYLANGEQNILIDGGYDMSNFNDDDNINIDPKYSIVVLLNELIDELDTDYLDEETGDFYANNINSIELYKYITSINFPLQSNTSDDIIYGGLNGYEEEWMDWFPTKEENGEHIAIDYEEEARPLNDPANPSAVKWSMGADEYNK
ncbi:MAG: hypothetical protein ACOCV8_00325, partial [Spirochaetota bacterium]